MTMVRMIDVSEKEHSVRRAVATGTIRMKPATVQRILALEMPKGDVLATSRVAGIMAAKRTSEILPLCHPLFLSSVEVRIESNIANGEFQVFCEAKTKAQTGVEMEALTGCFAALLCIYDMSKGVDTDLVIGNVVLLEKEGGRSGHFMTTRAFERNVVRLPKHELGGVKVGVVVSSDRAADGVYEDRTGPKLKEEFERRGAAVAHISVVKDDVERIRAAVRANIQAYGLDLVVVAGGTGLGPRDVTPEALAPLLTRTIPGFAELLRSEGAHSTPNAWLSRSVVGTIGETLVVTLPGSPKAVEESMPVLEKLVPHALKMMKGGAH